MDEILRRIMLLLVMSSFTLHAGVVITGTRVIYPASKTEVSVSLKNKGTQAALVQSWIDTGDPTLSPEKINVPFVVTPPIMRMDAGKGQSLRILYTGSGLPADRESVFWLNVLAIPPRNRPADKPKGQYLNIAWQTRIKLFFRPQDLKVSAEIAPSKLQWQKLANGFRVNNPTPYYISLLGVTWQVDNKEYTLTGDMVAPFDSIILSEQEAGTIENVRALSYRVVNDQGAVKDFSAAL